MNRFSSLDGLRGYASVLVVVMHAILVDQYFQPFDRAGNEAGPLQLAWLGFAAVMVFFVISGFVLTLPFLENRTWPDWVAYYPPRLLRLYLPVIGAVLLAAAGLLLLPRSPIVGAGDWINLGRPLNLPGPTTIVADLVLVGSTEPGQLVGPLWSLRWEVFFSLLLPLYVWVAVRCRRAAAPLAAGALMVVALSDQVGSGWFKYLPVFALGVLAAVRRDDLEQVACRLNAVGWLTTGLCALVLTSMGSWTPLPPGVAAAFVDVGALLIVLMFLYCTPLRRAGSHPVGIFLGRISFSLYLVHEMVILSLVYSTSLIQPLVVVALSVPISIGAGWLFYLLVERGSHRLSRKARHRILRRYGRDGSSIGTQPPAQPTNQPTA